MSKRYVGERVLQNCGEVAEIIELLPNRRCLVRFDSGIERECDRTSFSRQTVSLKPTSKRYVGERVLQKCGEYAEIIELLPKSKCRVRFDSGFEKDCNRKLFYNGEITHKCKRVLAVGDRFLQACGEYAEIIELLPNCRCIVRFDSGVERECARGIVRDGALSNRHISSRYVGERALQNCGEWAEIIELLDGKNCLIRFDSGVEMRCSRGNFKLGRATYKRRTKRIIGEKVSQNCGVVAELIAFKGVNECVVKFMDGYTWEGERGRFASGTVVHPLLKYKGFVYTYKKTNETVLSMYFDESISIMLGY